jgi:ABC-type phosphate transport system substrate-binding protein
MKAKTRAGLSTGLVGLIVTGLTFVMAAPAMADYAPQPGDIVGVGGDTPQYALEFVSDGDYLGDAGFNAAGAYNRLVTFNATADANGRSAYTNSVTTGVASVALNPTDVLRAGTFPVQRVQSSGAAISALLADTGATEVINFIFSASLPTAANQSTAASNGWGFLHVVEIGTDSVDIAADSTATNVPAGGLSINELLSIYTGSITKWNQLPGNSSGSSDAIVAEIPPSGSSIYKTFIADLTTANGGTAPVLSASVKTVEQNDPTAITSDATPADAIVPFSAARLALWNDGYFHNPATVFPGGAALTPGVKLLSGTAGDGNAAYNSPITDYVIFRQSDASSTAPMEPGGSRNWVQTLFSNPGGSAPFVEKAGGQALIAASGVTPNYQDLGDVS